MTIKHKIHIFPLMVHNEEHVVMGIRLNATWSSCNLKLPTHVYCLMKNFKKVFQKMITFTCINNTTVPMFICIKRIHFQRSWFGCNGHKPEFWIIRQRTRLIWKSMFDCLWGWNNKMHLWFIQCCQTFCNWCSHHTLKILNITWLFVAQYVALSHRTQIRWRKAWSKG